MLHYIEHIIEIQTWMFEMKNLKQKQDM